MLNNVYEDSYYRTIYELGKSNAVIDTAFGTIDENLLIKPKEVQQSSNPKSEGEVSLKLAENAAKTTQDKPKVETRLARKQRLRSQQKRQRQQARKFRAHQAFRKYRKRKHRKL